MRVARCSLVGGATRPQPNFALSTCAAIQGTYLLLEKLRYAVYRRLLRVVHGVHAQLEPEKRTQIPLLQFQTALALQVKRW